MDTIISKKHEQAIATITKRVLHLTYWYKIEIKDAESVKRAIIKTLRSKGLPVLTLTVDNGTMLGSH